MNTFMDEEIKDEDSNDSDFVEQTNIVAK